MKNTSTAHPIDLSGYRKLNQKEKSQLNVNNNQAEDWAKIWVTDKFDPLLIRNSYFAGENYISGFSKDKLSNANLKLPCGIYNSYLSDCILKDSVAIHNVKYLSNYIVGSESILFNMDEITCSENPKFGHGLSDKKTGERNWIAVSNENGGRKILAFEGILPADAFLWSRYKENQPLQNWLIEITDKLKENKSLSIGIIENNCLLKNVKSIEDCTIGAFSVIDGANRLSNLTILSNESEKTSVGDDVELVNGIVGYNNHIFAGAKCFDFVTGRNVKIELGARVLNTFVGSNSTIACCEVLNNLIFPFHEQHHNNSFLIASTIMGQSNIAAGATIGSNHNSRAADGEILAARGFWPGLESDFKHNSAFASYTLIAKGSFETELNVKLPFSLISKDNSGNLQIFPGFWFAYNMYALARNSWKFRIRDKRKLKAQNIEMDYLAPDTAFEIMQGINILEEAVRKSTGNIPSIDLYNFQKIEDLSNVFIEDMAPKVKTLIIKPLQAIWIYKNLILFFAARELVNYINLSGTADINQIFTDIPEVKPWINFGGQLISEKDTEKLINEITSKKLSSWQAIHDMYNRFWTKYPQDKLKYALACLLKLSSKNPDDITVEYLKDLSKHSINLHNTLLKWTIEARRKDYTNPFRKITYRNDSEMDAVLGSFDDDTFIKEMKKENKEYTQRVNTIISTL